MDFKVVNVFWGGAKNDKNKLFSILQPGDEYRQESAEGDVWFFKDAVWNKSLGQVTAKADQTVEIKELVRRMAVKESTWKHLNASYSPHEMRADDYALGFDGDDYVSVPHSPSLDLQGNWTLGTHAAVGWLHLFLGLVHETGLFLECFQLLVGKGRHGEAVARCSSNKKREECS